MNPKRLFLSAITGAAAFTLLTGARSCSGGYGSSYAYEETGYYTDDGYYYEEPVGTTVVVGGGTYIEPVPVGVDVVGDLALTIYAPYDDGVSPFTQTFGITVRQDSAYGPIILEGRDYTFDASGAGALDLTELGYGLYDVEVVGFDAYGASVSYAATTVTVDESLQYLTLELENTAVIVTGDVALDLQVPDSGVYNGPVDSFDYYLWQWDPISGQYVFVESVGYVPFDSYDMPILPALDLGWYYLEIDAFDYAGVKNYIYSGEFEHTANLTSLTVWLDYP